MQFNQLELANPYWLWMLPLPIIIYWLIPAYRTRQSAIKVPFFDVLVKALDESPSEGASQLRASYWQKTFLIISWCLLIFALTKPTILGEPQTRESLGR
ncbi:aerotolerance regulator BatA, partial [Aliivibrio sifiae]